MDTRKTLSVVVLAVALCVLASSCGGGASAVTPASKWVTISGLHVALQLPSSFEGGNPVDPKVMSLLRGKADSRSNPEERELLLQWLDFSGSTTYPPYLMAWEAPDDGGPVARVAIDHILLQNLLVMSGGDSSMRALVDAYMGGQTGWKLDSLKTREASVIVRDGCDVDFTVIKVDGSLLWVLRYSCREESWADLCDVFKQSADTFRTTP